MKLRTGTLVPGTETPICTGTTHPPPVRAAIRVDGTVHAAIVKRLRHEVVLAECFCALLLRGWGLPTPEPILVFEGGTLIFASIDIGYPNLAQRLGFSSGMPFAEQQILQSAGAAIVCTWDDAPMATAIDEAIANADRNLGNLLWDGADHAYIDHERTLGLIAQKANLLAELAKIAGKAEQIERGAISSALALDGKLPSKIAALGDGDFAGFVDYVEKRLNGLPARILNRFPKPLDLLSGLDPN